LDARQEKIIDELDSRLDELSKSMAIMSNDLKRQSEIIEKLSSNFEKLTVYIEKTNENDRKIETLFKKLDYIRENGTNNCAVNINRIDTLEENFKKISSYLISTIIAVLLQFFGVVIYIIDKHIK